MARRVLVLERGACVEHERQGIHGATYEAFLSIIEVYSVHKYEVRIERSVSINSVADHATFSLYEATILAPDAPFGEPSHYSTERELWSFTKGFSEERLIEVAGETLSNLRLYHRKCQNKMSLEIDPKQFYSKSSRILDIKTKKNADQIIEIFRVFPRQELAFQCFDELFRQQSILHKQFCLKIFSFEAIRTGQRKFLVADYDTFFRNYLDLDRDKKVMCKNDDVTNRYQFKTNSCSGNDYDKNFNNYSYDKYSTAKRDRDNDTNENLSPKPQKHVYEIIRENTPCRAYFDLEYQKEYNREINGNMLTAIWINLVVWKISELYGVYLNNDNIVVIDSSTDKKYSKHVIIMIPNNSISSTLSSSSSSLSSSVPSTVFEQNDKNQSDKLIEDCPNGKSKEILFRNNLAVGALVNMIMRDITEMCSKSENDNTESRNKICDHNESDSYDKIRVSSDANSIDINNMNKRSCYDNSNNNYNNYDNNDMNNNNNDNDMNNDNDNDINDSNYNYDITKFKDNGNNDHQNSSKICNSNSNSNNNNNSIIDIDKNNNVNEIDNMSTKRKRDAAIHCTSSIYANQRIPKPAFDQLWVNKENCKRTCFVDLGVYTKNRAFRLWNSSKFGKNVPFTILPDDRKVYKGLRFTKNHKSEDQYKSYCINENDDKIVSIRQLQDFILKRSLIIPFDLFIDINHHSKYLDEITSINKGEEGTNDIDNCDDNDYNNNVNNNNNNKRKK